MILLAMAGLLFVNLPEAPFFIYLMIALIGYGNSNIFPIIFSQALTHVPENQNEVSGLMIMGLFGGTIFPLLMGFASDWAGTSGAVMVMAAGAAYLVYFTSRIK